jgi:hypothetical protein
LRHAKLPLPRLPATPTTMCISVGLLFFGHYNLPFPSRRRAHSWSRPSGSSC